MTTYMNIYDHIWWYMFIYMAIYMSMYSHIWVPLALLESAYRYLARLHEGVKKTDDAVISRPLTPLYESKNWRRPTFPDPNPGYALSGKGDYITGQIYFCMNTFACIFTSLVYTTISVSIYLHVCMCIQCLCNFVLSLTKKRRSEFQETGRYFSKSLHQVLEPVYTT